MGFCLRTPWESDPAPADTPRVPEEALPDKRRGRRPADTRPMSADPPVWLYHHLTVSGPAESVAAFAQAARGAGVIPWRLDGARIEEDVFNLAVAQPPAGIAPRRLSIAGCRILARQFRARVEAHHDLALSRIGRSRICPFDLHVLLPVPAAILDLGPHDPAALAWLATHWGTTDRLRQVVARPCPGVGRRRPHGHEAVGYGFFTQDETPRAAIAGLTHRWPALGFVLRPRPPD
jgi:hypothetical protein